MSNLTHTPSTCDYSLEADRRGCLTRLTVCGRQTKESCLTEEAEVFGEIEEWLRETTNFPIVVSREEAIGMLHIAFKSGLDAVPFKLRWDDFGADFKIVPGTLPDPFS